MIMKSTFAIFLVISIVAISIFNLKPVQTGVNDDFLRFETDFKKVYKS